MNARILAFGGLLAFGLTSPADYVADRKAGIALVDAGKHEDAMAAFIGMAQGKVSDFQKSDALEQAARCAQLLGRVDEAMALARDIPLKPQSVTCQMGLLVGNRQWHDVVSRFGNEDIDAWPDTVKGQAFYVRGRANYFAKRGDAAAEDLKKAADYVMEDNTKGLALNTLGDTYQVLLKDDDRAVDAYRRVYETRNVYKKCHAAMAVAAIYRRRGRHDDAIAELGRIRMEQVTNTFWRGAMLCAWGDALADQGKRAAAVARYGEALELEGLSPSCRDACLKGIAVCSQ